MLPDRVSNPGPLTYESGALPIALRGPASNIRHACYISVILNKIQRHKIVFRNFTFILNKIVDTSLEITQL